MLTVLCVLRSGGDYDERYVYKLFLGTVRSLSCPFKFICMTDVDFPMIRDPRFHKVVSENLPAGWWSKVVTFLQPGPAVYLDLDTIITGSLDRLADRVLQLEQDGAATFWMLEGFRWQRGITDRGRWASGVMAWTGDWRWLAGAFDSKTHPRHYEWDQIYIQHQLKQAGMEPLRLQTTINVASYKQHCADGVPAGTDLVCFHGRPRPHEIDWRI